MEDKLTGIKDELIRFELRDDRIRTKIKSFFKLILETLKVKVVNNQMKRYVNKDIQRHKNNLKIRTWERS